MPKRTMLLIGAFALVAAACATDSPQATSATPETTVATTQPPVTVTVEVPTGGELVTLTARCKAGATETGRCNNLLKAVAAANQALEAAGDTRRVVVETIQDNADWGDYRTEFELASDSGQAPDIIVSGHEDIGAWAPAGLIIDLTDMIAQYPEFDDVIPSLWSAVEFEGRRWAIPQDTEARPLYFNKTLLAELGWSQEEIDGLPARIESGEFTWEDMMATAKEAVDAGVVPPGNGFWHRPKNGPDFLAFYYGAGGEIGTGTTLTFDVDAARRVYQMLDDAVESQVLSSSRLDGDWTGWHTGITSGQVLFWLGGTWQWSEWATQYLAEVGGEEYQFENWGFGLLPAMPGGDGPLTLSHPLAYMVSSQSENPDLAVLLIAKATTTELNTEYAVESAHLGILQSQADYEPYTSAKFLSEALPLLDYTTFLPNSPAFSAWSEAYYLGIQAVESGELEPDEAVEVVVGQLRNELGDSIEIIGA